MLKHWEGLAMTVASLPASIIMDGTIIPDEAVQRRSNVSIEEFCFNFESGQNLNRNASYEEPVSAYTVNNFSYLRDEF